jgi:hypothetical protein
MNDSILESRIQKLERQLKHQRWISVALLLAAAAVVGVAATTSPVSDDVRTKKLTIVNDNGQRTVELTTGRFGGSLEIYKSGGDTAVLVAAVRQSGGDLMIKSSLGEERAAISCDKPEAPISVMKEGKMHPLSATEK